MLFEKMVKAQDEGDVNSWRECLHDDWEFFMHSSGKVHYKGSADPEEWSKLIKSINKTLQGQQFHVGPVLAYLRP